MVTLEQIKQLDAKVAKAVELISQLRQENKALTDKLENYQLRIEELEILINEFKNSQGEIEEGILHALQELDKLEQSTVPPKAGKPLVVEEPAEEPGTELREEQPEPETTREEGEMGHEVVTEEEGTSDSELDIF